MWAESRERWGVRSQTGTAGDRNQALRKVCHIPLQGVMGTVTTTGRCSSCCPSRGQSLALALQPPPGPE